jgi:AGCS family alanine or glycine:cation symporter
VETLQTIVDNGLKYVWGYPSELPWLVVVLLGAGIFITGRLLFIQLRELKHAILVTMGRFDDPNDPGDVSHFQALATALSATVGIGNIAGVAIAIHFGGPGAVFWMWVTALFGMALKFAECTLSIQYRDFDDNGDAAGGPMYYIEKGLGSHWKWLAVFFAFCAVIASFGGGNMNQANTAALSAHADFGIPKWIAGIILAGLVGAVILGGIRSIAGVASKLAPSMALLYVLTALIILVINAGDVPGAFGTIFSEAFNPTAGLSGSVAGTLSVTLLWGVKRGLFSNEAGQGSAPIAHGAAKTNEPVREGVVAMLGPLIDTLIICTMTGLVIVMTGVWDHKKPDSVQRMDRVGISVAAERDKPDAPLSATVINGRQSTFSFTINDSTIDDPVIETSGGEPWSGKMVWKDGSAEAVGTDGATVSMESLQIRGATLLTSSTLTAWGFEKGLSPVSGGGNYIVTICVLLFALSTMISWSYYGDRCVTYLFGARYVILYRAVFIGFVFIGSILELKLVWDYGDLALGLMTVPNLIAVVLLSPKVVELTRDYFGRMRNSK